MANATMINLMERSGYQLRLHASFYKDDEDDEVWIPDVTRQGWVIITADKNIEREHLDCILDCGGRLVLLVDNNSGWVRWTASLISAQPRLIEMVCSIGVGPFVIRMARSGAISKVRFRPELVAAQKKAQTSRFVRAKRHGGVVA